MNRPFMLGKAEGPRELTPEEMDLIAGGDPTFPDEPIGPTGPGDPPGGGTTTSTTIVIGTGKRKTDTGTNY